MYSVGPMPEICVVNVSGSWSIDVRWKKKTKYYQHYFFFLYLLLLKMKLINIPDNRRLGKVAFQQRDEAWQHAEGAENVERKAPKGDKQIDGEAYEPANRIGQREQGNRRGGERDRGRR